MVESYEISLILRLTVQSSETARPENAVSESGYSSQHPSAALEGHKQLDTFPSPATTSFSAHDVYRDGNAPINVDNIQPNPLAGIGAGSVEGSTMVYDMPAFQFDGMPPADTNARLFASSNTADHAISPIDSIIASPARMGFLPSINTGAFAVDGQPPAFTAIHWEEATMQEPVTNPAPLHRASTSLRNSLSANRTADGQYACGECEKIFKRECDLR